MADQPAATPNEPSAQRSAAEAAAEEALAAAKQAVDSIGTMAQGAVGAPSPTPAVLPAFSTDSAQVQSRAIDLLADVNLNVKIELGRTHMLVEDVLKLGEGAVVELDKLAGDPVDVYVNERHVARGEVLVLNDTFCIRINEILSSDSGAKQAS